MIQFTYKLKLNERVRGKMQSTPATTQRKSALVDGLREHYFRIARDSGVTVTSHKPTFYEQVS